MPLNPLDNMPEALRRQNFATGKFPLISKEPQINGHLSFEGSMMIASSGHMERVSSPMNSMLKQGKVRLFTKHKYLFTFILIFARQFLDYFCCLDFRILW